MFPLKSALLLIVATVMLCTCTSTVAAEIFKSAGPWLLEQRDGSLRIGLELMPTQDKSLLGLIHVQDSSGETIDVAHAQRSKLRSLNGERILIHFIIGNKIRESNEQVYIHGVEQDPIVITLPQKPQTSEDACVLFCGNYNYPLSSDIERVESQLGQKIQLVVLLGSQIAKRIGRGGWEERIPIIVVHQQSNYDQFAQMVFGKQRQWIHGADWGCLGMPFTSDSSQILSVINKGLFDWQLYLDPDGLWDLSSIGTKNTSVVALRQILAVCSRKQLPIIVGAGHGSGFVSEPLIVRSNQFAKIALQQKMITEHEYKIIMERVRESGRSIRAVVLDQNILNKREIDLITSDIAYQNEMQGQNQFHGGIVIKEGGTRYITANAAGLAFRPLPHEVALPIYEPCLMAVSATTKDCRVILSRAYSDPLNLHYSVAKNEDGSNGNGWGEVDAEKDFKALEEKQLTVERMGDVHWCTRRSLINYFNTSSYRIRNLLDWLNEAQVAQPIIQIMQRRFMQMDEVLVLSWINTQLKEVPINVKRDCFLRCLGNKELYHKSDFQELVYNSSDAHIARSLIKYMPFVTQEERILFVDLLIKRLGAQLDGRIAMDSDPLLQREIMSLIFESPFHSPTPLRELAHKARLKGHEVAVGIESPIQRFFKRYGETANDD